jgi:hypothetical protein
MDSARLLDASNYAESYAIKAKALVERGEGAESE